MADQFTEVTRTGCLQNIFNSIIGALIGILMFLGSFVLLWYNEGRVNLAIYAEKSVPISAASVDGFADGSLVAATGRLSSPETLGDTYLRPGNYLLIERKAEMFAWVEHESTETRNKLGGGTEKITTYRYEQEWTADPESSSQFRDPAGHTNPEMRIKSATVRASSANLDAYAVDPQALELPAPQPVALSAENASGDLPLAPPYLVTRRAAQTSPQLGDIRVSYSAVPSNINVTLFGKASGAWIEPFDADGEKLYWAFTENREQAIATFDSEYKTMLWILRGAGFLLMWFGLLLGIGPLTAVLNVVPIAGSAGGCLLGAVAFVVALALSAVTILIAIIAHNIILLIGTVALLLVAGFFILRSRRQRQPGF